MLFSSITFLFFFLPITLGIYYLVPNKYKNFILLLCSMIFYMWGGILYLPLLLISIYMNYLLGIKIDKYKEDSKRRKNVLIVSIILNVVFLGIFKYTNFITDNCNILLNTNINIPIIVLPIGISFYTFQAMSYVIDVYRDKGKVQRSLLDLALYISMFPQLVAGPIVRYESVDAQIRSRDISFQKFNLGVERFIVGLFKKVVISNTIGEMSSFIYSLSESEISVSTAWLGVMAYTLQIYFDFSGYSDMAIGLGKMLGFDFMENFNYPYISKSVSEFWRRWHISLGSWFRDYVYIPLGGNKVSKFKIYRNLAVVWTITGIWHGASWNFIIWGMYFGVFIMIEKAFLINILSKAPKIIQHIYLLLIVMIGWVLFSQPSIVASIDYIKIMIGVGEYPLFNGYTIFYIKQYVVVIITAITFSMPIKKYLENYNIKRPKVYEIIKQLIIIFLFAISIIYLVNSTFNPFIYFNF